ncbi:MAG TPA: response regulator [Ktedonosporobacter sp.]|nr:response regulator [Ktedonosporobacter sp.]
MQHYKETSDKTILIVDDDRSIGEALQLVLREETNYRTLWMAESDLVLLSAPHMRPSLILLDYLMPVMDGLHLYDRLQESETMRGVPVVLMSAMTSLPDEALQQRGIRVLRKPFDVYDLLNMIDQFGEKNLGKQSSCIGSGLATGNQSI